jgi:hypothetical protein
MQMYMRQISDYAYAADSVVRRWRARRMHAFLELVLPPRRARILDLGGTSYNWELIEHDFEVTLVNLPDVLDASTEHEKGNIKRIVGDATDLTQMFDDQSFHVVFSNSVIEHVGNRGKRQAMAAEVHRLAPAHWVQTPSDRFPIEIHTGIPYFFRLPRSLRAGLLDHWQRTLPAWTDTIRTTTVIPRAEMRLLFPSSRLFIERKFGLEKSYSFYRPFRALT